MRSCGRRLAALPHCLSALNPPSVSHAPMAAPRWVIPRLWLGGEVCERAGWPAEPVVEVDAGGECEQSLRDPGAEVSQGAGAVAFEAEEVFAGPEDRLDPLADRGELRPCRRLVASRWPQYERAEVGHAGGELAAGVALVAHDRLATRERSGQQRQRDLTLGPVGGNQCRRAWCPVRRTSEMQSHPPKPARVATRVAVAAHLGQLRT